ncbi:uncharacterized protein LOC122808454 [Protopterus annectens]|uniref:uncharacterized protein LOC122808454 n=1 Tax=Protopterus annectens TaxID=7888 RepID=UPI001CFA1394|nr:uncharacterized protein LOC122808454 [Protopterus annectens]
MALVDTSSEITIFAGNPRKFRGQSVEIDGYGGAKTVGVKTKVRIAFGDGIPVFIVAVIAPVPEHIVGIDVLKGRTLETTVGPFRFGVRHCSVNAVKAIVRGDAKWEPLHIPTPKVVTNIKQYRIPGGHSEITETIQELLRVGILEPTVSPFNSPVWPVKKPDGSWRMTVDYRGLNKVAPPLTAAVPDIVTIVERLSSSAGPYHAVLDLANAFFSIPVAEESRAQFAFTWEGRQYTFQVLPQGYLHSPTLCHGLVARDLAKLQLNKVTVFHYIDDVLITEEKPDVDIALKTVIEHLQNRGWAINENKTQQGTSVKFLGMIWNGAKREIPASALESIQKIAVPKTKQQAQAFLGAMGFWRAFVPHLGQILRPIHYVTRKKCDFQWGPKQQMAFVEAKKALQQSVGLGPIDPQQPFILEVTVANNVMSWGLWQKNDVGKKRPLGFWSKSLTGAQTRYSPLEQHVLTVYTALIHIEGLTKQQTVTVKVDYPIQGWLRDNTLMKTLIAQSSTVQNGNEERRHNQQVDKMAAVRTVEENPEDISMARWAHDRSGHLGRDATMEWARRHGMQLSKDVLIDVIKQCEICQRNKRKQLQSEACGHIHRGSRSAQIWQIDFIGPLPLDQNQQYCLTMVDTYSGLLMISPSKKANQQAVLRGLHKLCITYGTPVEIQSDQGSHFTGAEVQEWARENGVRWVLHIPYHPQAASLIERYNGLLKEQIRKNTSDGTLRGWAKVLEQAIYAMNNSSTVFDGLGHIVRYTRGCKTVSSARIVQHVKMIINMTAVDITTRHSQCKSTNLWPINSLHLKYRHYQYRRNKRDVTGIMGTALGAVGTGTGFLNSIDIDTLRSKLSHLGEDLNMAFKLLADHDPELGQRTVDSVITQTVMWRWIDHANMYTEQVLNNLTKELNQSFCILSQLAANQQYLQFIQVWGAKRPNHWQNELQLYNWLKPLDFACENDSCILIFDYLASKKGTKQVCPFVALPLQFGNNWWVPQIESNLIDYNDVPIDLAGSICCTGVQLEVMSHGRHSVNRELLLTTQQQDAIECFCCSTK